jgi:hypothetical protein
VSDAVPGRIVEEVIAYVYDGDVLNTYDYVDVISSDGIGWQVKSTKADTPLTWKRAKIEGKAQLIEESYKSDNGLRNLGNEIIKFCNDHAVESMEKYSLKEIRYARCILHPGDRIQFFERLVCTKDKPFIFTKDDFEWRWSKQKNTTKKEQLSALHGIHKVSGQKYWAWHGLGENQLHFSGEGNWWSDKNNIFECEIDYPTEKEKISFSDFFDGLSKF